MNTKRNKDHKIIQTITVCHILDGINEYTQWCSTKEETKNMERFTNLRVILAQGPC